MKRPIFSLLIFPALIAGSVAGCASSPDATFPSLAKRPYEDEDPMASTRGVKAPQPASLPASLASEIAALESRAKKANSSFRALLPAVQTKAAAARRAGQGSDRWTDAQISLSRLDRSRADAVAALAELDQLLLGQLDDALSSGSPSYAPLMKPAQTRITAIVNAQNAEIDRLFGIIG
ncbi:MAG: hypothetical protein V3V15_09670 [Sphingorhabdus sp.]